MHEWKQLTDEEIRALDRRLPVLLPIGLIEAHGPHLAVSVDADTAGHFARRLAAASGAILAPTLPYGYADEMAEYPGTIGLTLATTAAVLGDLLSHFCAHGFTRLVVLSGHGANKAAFEPALERLWRQHPSARVAYWNYWTEAGLHQISHADQAETSIALAVGTRARMERVRDHRVDKPWYRLRSRHALDPESGGVNGAPSRASREEGERLCAQIEAVLVGRLRALIAAETAAGT